MSWFNLAGSIGDYASPVHSAMGFGNAMGHPLEQGWILFRPDCPGGSYSTGSASEQGDRDGSAAAVIAGTGAMMETLLVPGQTAKSSWFDIPGYWKRIRWDARHVNETDEVQEFE